MLIGLIAVIPTSDTFSSILMGIPGSSASQATVLDGFPLARQGQGARALSAAFFASMIGGFFGAVLLTVSVMAARPIILLFGSAELFMLTLFGLSTVAALSGGNLAKGVASACLGLAFGMIGAAPATGEYRMDFDTLYLSDGLPLVIVGLGIFALPELFNLLRGGGAIAEHNPMGTGWLQGVRDVLKQPLAGAALLGHRRADRRHPGHRRLGGGLDRLQPRDADDEGHVEVRQGRHPRRHRARKAPTTRRRAARCCRRCCSASRARARWRSSWPG
jgi:hypothetical protein